MTVVRAMILGFAVAFYTTFVLWNLWEWFAVGALGLPSVSYLQMYGLMLIINLVTHRDTVEERALWNRLALMSLAAVPPELKPEVDEELKKMDENVWTDAGTSTIGVLADSRKLLI